MYLVTLYFEELICVMFVFCLSVCASRCHCIVQTGLKVTLLHFDSLTVWISDKPHKAQLGYSFSYRLGMENYSFSEVLHFLLLDLKIRCWKILVGESHQRKVLVWKLRVTSLNRLLNKVPTKNWYLSIIRACDLSTWDGEVEDWKYSDKSNLLQWAVIEIDDLVVF